MEDVLDTLRARQVQMFRHGDRLVLHGATAAVDAPLRDALQAAKPALLRSLADDGGLFEMNVCQRSMALDELFRDNLSGNSIFIALNPARPHEPARMREIAHALHRRFPLLGAAAELDGERFCLRLSGTCAEPLVEDSHAYERVDDFVDAWTNRARSMFAAPLAQVVSGTAAGRRCWGLWMHHAVADAPFIDRLVALLRAALERDEPIDGPPDFDFLQHNGLIAQQVAAIGDRCDSHWQQSAGRLGQDATRAADPLPLVDAVSTVEWTLPDASTERLARALRNAKASSLALHSVALGAAIEAAGWRGPRVGLTTFSMRHHAPGPACSGFYTTLVPFLLAAPERTSSPLAAVSQAATLLRQGFDHALMPLERMLELASIDRGTVAAVVNLLRSEEPTVPHAASAAAPPLFLEAAADRLRRPLKLTLLESARGPRGAIFSARLAPADLQRVADAMRDFVSAFEQANA